ncbi:MAG TPA: hypothetical protein VIY73_12165 [Polyangiaceae bacterium]
MRALPIACDPGVFSSKADFDAHLAAGRGFVAAALERRELLDGWALRLPNDDETLLAVARWSVEERRCCPFFTFAIEREPAPGGLWLRITGPEGAKQVMAEAMGHTGA